MPENSSQSPERELNSFRENIHSIIFGAESFSGRLFDVALLVAILLSVVGFCLQTVESIDQEWGGLLAISEWIFTILFTIEYLLRLYCVRRPIRYALSFWGIIDLLAFLPTYLGLFLTNTPSFVVIRSFRLLRVFRIMKLKWLMREADELGKAVYSARAKIVVFLGVVLIAVTIAGTLMYEIEHRNFVSEDPRVSDPTWIANVEKHRAALATDGMSYEDLAVPASKFTSIPEAIYWATVTMTTVGYGDIVPTTVAGKILATILILLGYSLIIVPTGFVSAEFMKASVNKPISNRSCASCLTEGHDQDAKYCKYCGEAMSSIDANLG